MPAEVNRSEGGNYSIVHAEGENAGEVFFETTGFGPLVFSTESRAMAVASAINAEMRDRGATERSLSQVFKDFEDNKK